jgi:hypothetical protein
VPPVTIPEVVSTGATVTELLVHVPPVVASLKLKDKPEQTAPAPEDIAAGDGFIVAIAVL